MSDVKTDEKQLVAEVETEAKEIDQEIKEATEEAKEAREAGDHERANKLEARVDALAIDLSEIKDTLKKLAERPFAPAPAPKKTEEPKVEEKVTEEPEEPKERKHRFGSTRWFGDRAYED